MENLAFYISVLIISIIILGILIANCISFEKQDALYWCNLIVTVLISIVVLWCIYQIMLTQLSKKTGEIFSGNTNSSQSKTKSSDKEIENCFKNNEESVCFNKFINVEQSDLELCLENVKIGRDCNGNRL